MLNKNRDSQNSVAGANMNGNDDVNTNMEHVLCSYIMTALLPPECGIDLKPDDDLLSIDYLDSMQFMRLVQFTEETYELKIPAEDLLIENFQTVDLLTIYLKQRMASA